MSSRPVFRLFLILTIAWAISHTRCHAQRNVTWIGGGGAWEHDPNWIPLLPDGSPLQPFDPDAVFIPSGVPVITFLEGINTLDVDAGAGIANNGVLSVHNGVVNDGLITFGPNAQIIIDAGGLAGAGEIVLADSTGTNATLQGAPFGGNPCCVLHASTHTVRGEGTVVGKWVNDGLIRAEETSGDSAAVLTISGQMTNNGVIRSTATGTILLESAALTMGATGQFIADGQSIVLSTATITGGSISAINGAKFVRRPDAGGSTVFSGVTINADFDVLVNNAGVTGTGTGIINNGTMTIDNLNVGNGELAMDPGSTLGGTGQVVLNRGNDNTHISGNFTQASTHTIRGVGKIQATIANNGTIIAEPKNGGTVLRVPSSTFTNKGLLLANSGATLRFEQESSVTQLATGRIRAANGGTVELRDNATITGGKLQTEGTGIIVDTSASVLTNVTNEGNFHVQAGSTTRIKGTTLTNNGVITVNPTGAAVGTPLEFDADVTIQGTGSIVLNQTGNGARITNLTGNEIITQAAGHTIRGKGLIDNAFGSGRFVNHGRIEGASALEPLGIFTRISGDGVLKDVTIGGGFILIQHILGEIGTTAVVPVEGLYTLSNSSALLVDLAGTTPGSGYDRLSSTGTIALGATNNRLDVSLANGFKPLPGSSFTLLTTTGSLTGSFGNVNLPTLPLGLSWTQTQTSTSFSIGVTGSLAADFDEDGDVDGDDLVRWQAGYNTSSLHTQGNADGDGDVDGQDFLVWQRSYGWGVPGLAASLAVPEPDVSQLLMFLVAGAFLKRVR